MSENPNCDYCSIIKEKRNKVYEDDVVFAFATESPATAGHIIVVPKEHHPIFEEVPDKTAGHLFFIANKISVAVFESIGAHGTNLVVNNGVSAGQDMAHFAIHIIPRRENDGIKMEWAPKELSDDEMGTAELMIKNNTKSVGIFEKEKSAPVEVKEEKEEIKAENTSEEGEKEENYMVKQLRRIP